MEHVLTMANLKLKPSHLRPALIPMQFVNYKNLDKCIYSWNQLCDTKLQWQCHTSPVGDCSVVHQRFCSPKIRLSSPT